MLVGIANSVVASLYEQSETLKAHCEFIAQSESLVLISDVPSCLNTNLIDQLDCEFSHPDL